MANYVCTFTDKNCIENILKVWLPSLQKNFSGKIVVITFNVSEEDKEKLRNENVIVVEEDPNISGLYKTIEKRLDAQERFIETLGENDKIMLIDGADVVFQSEIDSFFKRIEDKIFYSTTGTISNKLTIKWINRLTKGLKDSFKILEKLKNKEIIASGMLVGKKKYFLKFFKKYRAVMKKFNAVYFTGINQAILTYLIIRNSTYFEKTDIHNCRITNENVIKEDGLYKIYKTIPIIHFSCPNQKKIYKETYLNNSSFNCSKINSLNILWLYGSIPKFDAINHWYHTGFARVLANKPNVNLLLYGYNMEKVYPDMAKIPFNPALTGEELKKLFDFDVVIMDNKNRFAYAQPREHRIARAPRNFWLKPKFFDGIDNIPKVFLEGDYHIHFRMNRPEERGWYKKRKVDLLLVRHKSSLDYHQDKSIPIQWFPCSVNDKIFKPNSNIERKNKICLISGYGTKLYHYRNTAGKVLATENLIDIYKKRFLGKKYIQNLQSYICHLSGSSNRAITPAKMFEIMASGSVLFTDEGDEYGLKELFPDDSYVTYNKKDYSDVISKAKKIINEPDFRKYLTTKALKCIKEKHTHEVRAEELLNIITKTFNIPYQIPKEETSLIAKVCNFFIPQQAKETTQIKNTVPQEIKEEEKIDIEKRRNKNNRLLRKLYNKQLKICLLENTCYEVVINNRVDSPLNIAVDNEKLGKELLGQNFIFKPMPKITKKFEYKGMTLHVPYPIIPYLTNYKGKGFVAMLVSKSVKLVLKNSIYQFRKR